MNRWNRAGTAWLMCALCSGVMACAAQKNNSQAQMKTASSEGKSSEGKSSEGKSSEGKSSEGKSSEGKSSETADTTVDSTNQRPQEGPSAAPSPPSDPAPKTPSGNEPGAKAGAPAPGPVAPSTQPASPVAPSAKPSEDETPAGTRDKATGEGGGPPRDVPEDLSPEVEAKDNAEADQQDGNGEGSSADGSTDGKGTASSPEPCQGAERVCKVRDAKGRLVSAIDALKKALGEEPPDPAAEPPEPGKGKGVDSNLVSTLEEAESASSETVSTLRELMVEASLAPSLAMDALLAGVRARLLEARLASGPDKAARQKSAAKGALEPAQAIADSVDEQVSNVEKKKDAEKEALAAEAERLMRFGVSFGVAATVNAPIPYKDNRLATLEAPAAGVMPYLLFMPAFWGGTTSKRAYCAAEWSASQAAAEAAAEEGRKKDGGVLEDQINALRAEKSRLETALDERRKQRAQVILAELENSERTNTLEKISLREQDVTADLKNTREKLEKVEKKLDDAKEDAEKENLKTEEDLLKRKEKRLERELSRLEDLRKLASRDLDSLGEINNGIVDLRIKLQRIDRDLNEEGQALRQLKVDAFSRSCWKHKWLGFFVGYPATFNVTTTVPRRTLEDQLNRDLNPVIAFGWAGAPNALVSLLFGPSVGVVDRDDGTDAVYWALTAGLGGNADLINLIR